MGGSAWSGCHSLAVVNGGGSFASGSEWWMGHSLEVVAVVVLVVVVAVVAAAGSRWQPQQLLWLGWMVRGENMININITFPTLINTGKLTFFQIYNHIVPFSLSVFSHSAESPKNLFPAAARLPKTNIFRAEIGEARASGNVLSNIRRWKNLWKTSKNSKNSKHANNSQTLADKIRETLKGKLDCERGVQVRLSTWLGGHGGRSCVADWCGAAATWQDTFVRRMVDYEF